MTMKELKMSQEAEVERLIRTKDSAAIMRLMEVAGWTPPVDPDFAEVDTILGMWGRCGQRDRDIGIIALAAIKRGRALEHAEAKSGLFGHWKKHDGTNKCPAPKDAWVVALINHGEKFYADQMAKHFTWENVTHYCEVTPPEGTDQ